MMASTSATKIAAVPRRMFLRVLGTMGVVAAFPEAEFLRNLALAHGGERPVVAFHMDQLYVDWSGRAAEYVPPAGLRSAEILGQLSEADLRWNFTYI